MDVQQAIERLYEDESLTSALDDAAAEPLMKWAERQLERLTQSAPDEPRFEQDFAALRKLIKRIGRYIDRRREWSEAEQADELDVIKDEAASISAPLTITTPADYAKKPALEVVATMIGAGTVQTLTGVIATANPDSMATTPIPIQRTEQQTGDSSVNTAKGSESQRAIPNQGQTRPLPPMTEPDETRPLVGGSKGGQSVSTDAPENPETPKKDGFLGDLIKRIFEE